MEYKLVLQMLGQIGMNERTKNNSPKSIKWDKNKELKRFLVLQILCC
jgi:hypothetical protein